MGRYGVTARLVWDGGKEIRLPPEMGKPRADQLQGTVGERLAEVAGRICYDSLGSGRNSADYHKHILQVGHGSVFEHHHLTVQWNRDESSLSERDILWAIANRPGIWLEPEGGYRLRLTFNARTILDWDKWNEGWPWAEKTPFVGKLLRYYAQQEWPQIMPLSETWHADVLDSVRAQTKLVESFHDEEKWVSMYMSGSRGFSHEQVRHGDRTAISQRSTRFVDESESSWIDHPLEQEFAFQTGQKILEVMGKPVVEAARRYYEAAVETLQGWLISKGVDKLTARKQARGAARGKLGNALETQMVFSASVAQWKRMIRLRCNPAADAEIRAVYVQVLEELGCSRYANDFERFKLIPSPDGMGLCAVEEQ